MCLSVSELFEYGFLLYSIVFFTLYDVASVIASDLMLSVIYLAVAFVLAIFCAQRLSTNIHRVIHMRVVNKCNEQRSARLESMRTARRRTSVTNRFRSMDAIEYADLIV